MSTCTPGGTYTKEPPDHTAVFSAENLLSPGGITVPKYSWNSSGCSFNAVSVRSEERRVGKGCRARRGRARGAGAATDVRGAETGGYNSDGSDEHARQRAASA